MASVLRQRPVATLDEDTFYAFVEADSPKAAVAEAQRTAFLQTEGGDDSAEFAPLLVIGGHHAALPVAA